MKNRFTAICIILALALGFTASAAAGSPSDPLISVSYIEDTYLPNFFRNMEGHISTAKTNALEMLAQYAQQQGTRTLAISGGGSVSMSSGQCIVLLSGSAQINIASGTVINASYGVPAVSGTLNINQRYILCEDTSATVEILDDARVCVSAASSVKQGDGLVSPFTDVTRKDWFFESVVNACNLGLISGRTTTTYVPAGTLTVAETIRLAASMHELYHTGKTTIGPAAGHQWYTNFVDYAYANGIISEEYTLLTHEQYDTAISRSEFVHIFYCALPASNYGAINSIPDGAIPDLAMTDTYADEIYTFYRAGILAGYTGTPGYAEHAFGAASTLRRDEMSSILYRMFEPGARTSFTIG